MLNDIFNLFMTIGVYIFLLYLFWSALKSIKDKIIPPKNDFEQYSGGNEYE